MLSIPNPTRFLQHAYGGATLSTSNTMQPRADVEKKNALPIVSSLATPSTQGDGEASSIERSVFMNVLTALYTPASDEPGTAPPPPRQTVHSRKRKRRVSSYDMIQWTPEPQPDEADSSEDEQYRGGTMTDAGFGPKLLRQPLYKPHGMWAWADGLPVTNSQILLHLGGEHDTFTMSRVLTVVQMAPIASPVSRKVSSGGAP